MKLSICREYEFAAAHQLPLHEGKCQRPHGHNYTLEVEVTGTNQNEGPGTGMVMDFDVLDWHVKKYVLDVLDHQDLNTLPALVRLDATTAENVCGWIAATLRTGLMLGVEVFDVPTLTRVRLYETPRSWAEVTY